jgi:Fic family protein
MSFIEKLQEIEQLQNTIEQHGKIAADTLRKINYKFRLDWNYYSNLIEGNSLTMQETRSIMIGNITVDGKPIKDVMEMKGHDDVISDILKIGKSELNLSEKRIKDIHKGIMHEDDVSKQPFIGQWKTEPNYLYNYKKERVDFTAPADVKDEMHKLINWLNTEKEKIARKAKDALHPIQLAFHFHIDYVTIHPFYDGNGRTARIFTNLILISYGYPPLYVKDTERETYNQYLGEIQTYGADTELFYDFMSALLIRSQQLVVDALEGKIIDEANDWQKKIQLLKLERNNETKASKTNVLVHETITKNIVPFLKDLMHKLADAQDLFGGYNLRITTLSGEDKYFTVIDNIKDVLFNNFDVFSLGFTFQYDLLNLKPNCADASALVQIKWKFDEFKYLFFVAPTDENKFIAKSYNDIYTQNETEEFINVIGKKLYEDINILIQKDES